MPVVSLRRRAEVDIHAAGLALTIIGASIGVDDLGDGEVVGQLGPILIRFVRERGQDWVELAPAEMAEPRFFFFDDIGIAFGWKTVDEVLDQKDVEPLASVLRRVAHHWHELCAALSVPNSIAWARVAAATKERGEVFAARLR